MITVFQFTSLLIRWESGTSSGYFSSTSTAKSDFEDFDDTDERHKIKDDKKDLRKSAGHKVNKCFFFKKTVCYCLWRKIYVSVHYVIIYYFMSNRFTIQPHDVPHFNHILRHRTIQIIQSI